MQGISRRQFVNPRRNSGHHSSLVSGDRRGGRICVYAATWAAVLTKLTHRTIRHFKTKPMNKQTAKSYDMLYGPRYYTHVVLKIKLIEKNVYPR